MGMMQQWRYKILLGMITYLCVACLIACALLWNIAVSPSPVESQPQNVVISSCATDHTDKTSNGEDDDPYLNCPLVESLNLEKFVAHGWTKVVHRARINNRVNVAVKTVNFQGKDISDCARNGEPGYACHNKATEKLVREIQLLRHLHHETIINLKYYCAKTSGNTSCIKHAVIVTELGEPLTNLRLLQLTWDERRLVIQDLARLIHFASNSSIGSLGLVDLRRPQCVLVNSRLKLADLDDIVIGEPSCKTNFECSNLNISVQCIADHCYGYNAKLNIQKSYQEFGPYLFIPDGVPKGKRKIMDKLRLMWRDNIVTPKTLLSTAMLV